MKHMLETMYIMTPESYLFHRNDNICISIGGEEKASVPVNRVESIVFFGKNSVSTSLLSFCSEYQITMVFLDLYGRFIARLYKEGENLARIIMTNTAHLYGYESLDVLEEKL